MNPWIAKVVILAASVAMVVIRAPHGRRSRRVNVARSCKGPREVALLTLAWIGFLVPLIWVVSPVFSFAGPASCLAAWRWRLMPRSRPLVVPPVTLGPRDVLVGHPRTAGEPSTHYAGGLPLRPSPNVRSALRLLHRPGPRSAELACRPVVRRGVWNSLHTSYRCRGKDDARDIRRRIPGVHGKDKAAAYPESGDRAGWATSPGAVIGPRHERNLHVGNDQHCALAHGRLARCETGAPSTEEMSTCDVGRCAFSSACVA